ncbi:MAG: hypothetical protein ACI87E_003299 [Mariniblastus sp.]
MVVPSIIQASSSPVPSPPIVGSQDQLTLPSELNFTIDRSQIRDGNAAVSIDPTYFSAPPSEAPVIANSVGSGCSSCGGQGCSSCGMSSGNISGCTSCGTGGCFDDGSVANQFGSCGSVYTARRYMIAEALYFNRDDGSIVNSNFGGLNSFDANLGWRFTFGTRNDATNGQEFTYFGTTEMEQTATRIDAGARINSGFIAVGGLGDANLSAFSDATLQTESKDTTIHSLEFNRVKWGWDVVKTFVGIRYINVDDNYRMFSQSSTIPLAANRLHDGTFEMNTQNHMIGPHVGGELFYDIGNRLSWSLASKAGVYANFNNVDTTLINDGSQFLNVEDENATLSTSLELGLVGHYQLSKQARFRFGYTALWLGEVASVSDNLSPFVSPATGTNTSDSDDMFFHGVSFGFEIFR